MNQESLRHRETTGVIILDSFGRFLLQQRDDLIGIASPGKIGLFGGHRESGETPLECIVREVHEETGFFIPPERFEHLGSFDGADIDIEGGTLRGHLFVVRDIHANALVITEGALVIVDPADVSRIGPRLAPTAQAALDIFLNGIPTKS
jgi:8-oxo-dGTP pyrophosphatase MutT (NUDIX family)